MRYLVITDDVWEPDWAVVESGSPEDAAAKFESFSTFYEGHVAIVAEVRIDNLGMNARES